MEDKDQCNVVFIVGVDADSRLAQVERDIVGGREATRTTTEGLFNDLLGYLFGSQNMQEFYLKYTASECLIITDLQFAKGKTNLLSCILKLIEIHRQQGKQVIATTTEPLNGIFAETDLNFEYLLKQ